MRTILSREWCRAAPYELEELYGEPEHGKNGWVLEEFDLDEPSGFARLTYSNEHRSEAVVGVVAMR